MTDVVRVSSGGQWAYVPVGGETHSRLCRFANEGLAETKASEIRLHSEAGPLFWDMIKPGPESPYRIPSASIFTEHGLYLVPGEELQFGRNDDGHYNEFADMSRLNNPSLKSGCVLSGRELVEGDIVVTAWPHKKSFVPALVSGPRSLELTEPVDAMSRCFVMDDDMCLMTASLSSDGSNFLRVLPPDAIVSWLFSMGSQAIRQKSNRFSVSPNDDGTFAISDSKKNRTYSGKFKTDRHDVELESLDFLLDNGGLWSVLSQYRLFNL